jgi:hypothetical protein
MCLERLLEGKGRLLLYVSANEILPTISGGSVDVDTWIHFEHGCTLLDQETMHVAARLERLQE